MAIFDRMRDRMRGQRPIGAAQEMQRGGQPPARMTGPGGGPGMQPGMPGGPGMQQGMPGPRDNREHLQPAAAGEEQLDRLQRGRTPEEEDAFMLGRRMGLASLAQEAGVDFVGSGENEGGIMNRERLNSATNTLLRYRAGKASVNQRVVAAQQWWKLKNWEQIRKDRGTIGTTEKPSNTGWLWNCIVGKHADAIDSYPEPIVLPRSSEDKEEANRLSKIIPVVLEMNDFEETYNDVMWQKMQEGTAVYGVFWDNTKLNGMGDISIKKVNILNLYWEPGISDIQESRNVFFVSYEEKTDLEQWYPELQGQLDTTKLFIEKYHTDDNIDMTTKAAVIDWYYKKREGNLTVLHYCKYVGEVCIYSSEVEGMTEGYYADGEYPFVLDPLFPVEGSPAGYGYIDIARDTQADIDTLSQAMVKNAAMRATPRYFSRKDGSINEKEFMDWHRPIVHTGGGLGEDSLRPIEVAAMGGDAHNMLQEKIDEIKFITGNTDVHNGGVPSGVTAASAIAALKEDSGRSSKDSTKASYRAYRKIILMSIERVRQFYDIPRQFRILGQDGQEEFVNYSNAGLQVQQIQNMPGQEPGLRLPLFDIDVRAQRENAYTKMSQNELALQFWSNGILNPQMTDQALIVLDMMDFRGKDEIKRKIQQQGTLRDALQQIGQIALQLAVKYEPQTADQLAGILQGIAGQLQGGAAPQAGGGLQKPQKKLAPDDATEAPHEANESGIVRNARERAANATRPD